MADRVRRRHPWSGASILTKGILVIILPVLVLSLSSVAVFATGRAYHRAEHQREAAESVGAAVDQMQAIAKDGTKAVVAYYAADGTRTTPTIERLKGEWRQAVRALTAAASAQPDVQLQAEVGRVRTSADDLLQLIGQYQDLKASRSFSAAAVLARADVDNRVVAAGGAVAAAHATSLALAYNARFLSLSRAMDLLTYIGTPLGLAGAVAGMLVFAKSIVRRVRHLEANATALGEGASLVDLDHDTDELGQLGRGLDRAAALLRAREAALGDAIAEAERANIAKSAFLSRVSHELRTPLNAILGFGQLLEMEDLSESQEESVRHVLRGGRHLLAVIDDVLDISSIESGTLSMSIEPVGLVELLEETIALVNPLAQAGEVRLHAVGLPNDDLHVLADRRRLKQVILNLASNAIKFNQPGGVVTFQCSASANGRVRLDVIDTGRGIAEDMLDRLFTPFDRLGADQTDVEGTGIGLALSQRLAEALGGSITVESDLGRGSTFSLDLPLSAPIAAIDDADPAELGDEGRDGPSGSILYIEDNPSNLKLVQRVIERRPDLRMTSAATGAIGLSLAGRAPFDVILLDIHLPDMSGETVLRELQQSEATRTTPIIILSADATPGQIQRLLDAGASDYLTKPLDLRQLMRVVDTAIAGVPS